MDAYKVYKFILPVINAISAEGDIERLKQSAGKLVSHLDKLESLNM